MLFCTIGYIPVLECSIKFKKTKKGKWRCIVHIAHLCLLVVLKLEIMENSLQLYQKNAQVRGIFVEKDCDWVCIGCKKVRVARGNSNPASKLMNWFYKLGRAIGRSSKKELTSLDIVEAQNFSIINVKYLNVEHGILSNKPRINLSTLGTCRNWVQNFKTHTFRLASNDSLIGGEYPNYMIEIEGKTKG